MSTTRPSACWRPRAATSSRRRQGCCGALALHAGRLDEAREFARRTIAGVRADRRRAHRRQCRRLRIVDEGVRPAARRRSGWAARARGFRARVRDVTELLVELGAPRAPRHPLASARRVPRRLSPGARAGHPPAAARSAAAIPGVELVAFAEQELCCGSAGIYNLVQPERGARSRRRKVGHIAAVAARRRRDRESRVHAADCRDRGAAGRTMSVLHPIELIDASIRGADATEVVKNGAYFRAAR